MRTRTRLYYNHIKKEVDTMQEVIHETSPKQQYLDMLQRDREQIETYIKEQKEKMPTAVALALQEAVLRLHFTAQEMRKEVVEEVLACDF